ncbi:hypothetical protein CLOM_g16325, partial [Closterium sp. NIES-68]
LCIALRLLPPLSPVQAEKGELREEKARLQANKQQLEDQVRRMAASGGPPNPRPHVSSCFRGCTVPTFTCGLSS